MRYVLLILTLSLVGCSSTPRFDKLRTADEVIENYDSASYKSDGLFITKAGAVVDIKFEEVKEQKVRLERELKEANDKIEKQRQAIEWLERDNIQMRTRLGLSIEPNSPVRYSGKPLSYYSPRQSTGSGALYEFGIRDNKTDMSDIVIENQLQEMMQ